MNTALFYRPKVKLMTSFLLICFVTTGFVAMPAFASSPPLDPSGSQTREPWIKTGDLETFTNELITRQLEQYHIAGATISIVTDGKIQLAKGYGYANISEQVPVSPSETIFRTGSISKLFTWTAVMQLAEQGKIDLNADINTYLPDFKIPTTFPEPITMLNLMSHSAGFEERSTGTESVSPGQMISIHDYLQRYMPDRIRPAGELITYSNYGAALAGYIVEVVSGMPFEEYIESYVFKPLSMAHSTFRQPLPVNLADHLAKAYSYKGKFIEGSFVYPNLLPAATMDSTALDMANFIIANLQGGKYGENQILAPETMLRMHSHLFSDDERLDGFAYGYMEWNYHRQRVLWHSGDIGNWHSGLVIVPDQDLGFFVGYNSIESVPAVYETYYAILDAFFPAQTALEPQPSGSSSTVVKDLAGEYRSTRSFYNHIERIASFPGNGHVNVKANPDGTLAIAGVPLIEKEPLVFTTLDGTDTVIFHSGEPGLPTHMQLNSNQLFAYERLAWYETTTFNLLAFPAICAVLVSALPAYLVGLFRNRKGRSSEPQVACVARVWSVILSVAFLLAPITVVFYMQSNSKLPFPAYMVIALAIILAASILVIGTVIFTVFAWVRRYWNLAGRIHYTLITLALLGMVWLMYYWRLLGFRYS